MRFDPPDRSDFEVSGGLELDAQNTGFTEQEVEAMLGAREFAAAGQKGLKSSFSSLWKKDRQAPPELANLKSEFGYHTRPILTDLVEVANAQGTELAPMIRARIKKYNFYIMRCGAFISPNGGEKFEALKFRVTFEHDDVSTFSMLPEPHSKKLLEVGGNAEIGVTGDLAFELGANLIDKGEANANAKADFSAKFIVSFNYELKTQTVDAYGIGNSFCQWLMYTGDKLRNDVVFYPIVMTPKSVVAFNCEFKAFFRISHPDWKSSEFFLKKPATVPVSA